MSLYGGAYTSVIGSFPRVSGDEPRAASDSMSPVLFSPRERG